MSALFSSNTYAKTAIILPGLFAHEGTPGYSTVIRTLEKRGYQVHTLDIRWWALDMESYSREVVRQFGEIPADPDTVIVASSYGAFLALAHVDEIRVKTVVLVSPAPLFQDYVAQSRRISWTRLISRLFSIDRATYLLSNACDWINRENIHLTVLYATRDTRDNQRFARALAKCVPQSESHYVRGGHGIRSKKTRSALVRYLATSEDL